MYGTQTWPPTSLFFNAQGMSENTLLRNLKHFEMMFDWAKTLTNDVFMTVTLESGCCKHIIHQSKGTFQIHEFHNRKYLRQCTSEYNDYSNQKHDDTGKNKIHDQMNGR